MQLGALAGQQVVDDDLAQQRVAERVAALLVGDHELGGDGLAHRVAQRARVDPGGLGEERVVQPPAGREHPQRSCASADSRSIRSISASRSVGGSEPRPSVPAASSSSANSGLPSERANSRDSRSSPGASPRMSLSCSASSARVSGSSSTRRARASRSSSASSGRSGWRRCSSSGR